MTEIEKAIRERVDRFNRLFLKATGHSFEDDPKYCEELTAKEKAEWQPKLDAALRKYNFESLDAYRSQRHWKEDDTLEGAIEEIDDVLREEPRHSSLFGYDDMIHQQVKEIIDFMTEKYDSLEEGWKKISDGLKDAWDVVENLKKDGFTKWDEGHSGNSGAMTIMLVKIFITARDLFPYSHGALCYLVGDEEYHDDRSDIPAEIIEKYSKKD